MGVRTTAAELTAFFKGRWQVPLAIIAAGAVSLALWRLRPEPLPADTSGLMADVELLAKSGALTDAADAAANLLEMDPPLPQADRARLHELLADVIYQSEAPLTIRNRKNIERLLEHHEKALDMGRPEDTQALMRVAAARDWLGDAEAAAFHYRRALDANPRPEQRREAIRRLVTLLEGNPDAAAERQRYLFAMLTEGEPSPAAVWWALQRAMADALQAGNVDLARQLLEAHGERLRNSDLHGYYEYLMAWVLVNEERYDEAAPTLDWVDEWMENAPLTTTTHAELSNLPALTHWLRGRLELAEWRPQRALQAFDQVLSLTTSPDLQNAAMIGRAQALDQLERVATALETLRAVAARLVSPDAQTRLGAKSLMATLDELYERRRERGEYARALDYLELEVDLVPDQDTTRRAALFVRLGTALVEAAEHGAERHAAGEYQRDAGRYFERAAELITTDAERRQNLLWQAAQAYDGGGLIESARRTLLQFVDGPEDDPRQATALLNLGQGYEVQQRYEDAVTWYRRLIEAFPRVQEAVWARVYAADCLMALGEDHYDEAYAALDELLSGDVVRPESPAFREAFMRLCDLLHEQGRYADAISRLEDFQRLYPQDPAGDRVLFLLAESYRRSALELRQQAADASEDGQRYEQEAQRRFQMAAVLYGQYLAALPARLEDERDAAYERIAMFCRGDCLFEVNTPESLDEALTVYRQVAARYENRPAALSAEVQIANVHLRRGEVLEAARAIERARWLLRNIPPAAFEQAGCTTARSQWERYLQTVASSHLFREALASR